MTCRSLPLASHNTPSQPLRQLAHAALRTDEQSWRKLRDLGLRLCDGRLHEIRACPDCHGDISREIDAVTAIRMLVGRLKSLAVPDVLVASAQVLADWAAHSGLRSSPATQNESAEALAVIRIPVGTALVEAERQLLVAALNWCGGNRSETAKLLGLSRRTLYNKLQSLKRRKLLSDPLPPARSGHRTRVIHAKKHVVQPPAEQPANPTAA